MKCFVELRPNVKLLQPNFDGYKLSLNSIPTWRNVLENKVDRVYPSEDQYSLIHAKLFGLHNNLVYDWWGNSGVFYIDEQWKVNKATLLEHQLVFEKNVFEIPTHVERQPGHYQMSFQFCSEQFAVMSDGAGTLHIVKTGNRSKSGNKWDCVFSDEVLGPEINFIIAESRIEYENGKEIIQCVLQYAQQRDKTFDTVLEWITLERNNQTWNVIYKKQLKGQGCVHYVALEPKCRGIFVASDHPFSLTGDTNSEVTEVSSLEPREKKIVYTWLQTDDDITLNVNLGNNCDKTLVNVETTTKFLNIVYNGRELLKGDLFMDIDAELTTWNVEAGGRLDVLLTKNASGTRWEKFLKDGDMAGEELLDPDLVASIHQRLAHLCSETEIQAESSPPAFSNQQLEECDAVSEENTCLVRLDAHSHEITHQAPLSVHQIVLTVNLNPSEPLSLGLRHDVDTCIWQPTKMDENTNVWQLKHEGTLHAFGYVQSSKQQKKFTVCSPNMEYSVVCEGNRHCFIYRSKCVPREGCQLRQRVGLGENRTVSVGQQQVVSLDKEGDVLGITATNEVLYILTENNIIAMQMM